MALAVRHYQNDPPPISPKTLALITHDLFGDIPLMPESSEERKELYDRGVKAGEIAAQLAEHDRHLTRINGSMELVAHEMSAVKLALQRLADQGDDRETSSVARDTAREATVKTTAAALRDAEEARRDKSEQSWSPTAKVLAVLGTIAALAGVAIGFYVATGPHH